MMFMELCREEEHALKVQILQKGCKLIHGLEQILHFKLKEFYKHIWLLTLHIAHMMFGQLLGVNL